MTAGLGKIAARGAGITLMSQVIRFALQLGSLMVLARLLSPQEFGVVAMVTAITNVMEIVRDFGLSSAVMQAKELNDAERTNLFWANTGIGTGCALVVMVSAPLIVRLYGTPVVGPIVLALGWLFIVSGVNTQFRAELSRSLRFKALAVTDIAAQAGSIAAAISLAAAGTGRSSASRSRWSSSPARRTSSCASGARAARAARSPSAGFSGSAAACWART